MPNIKSAVKRVKVSSKKTLANKIKKSEMRTIVKQAKQAINSGLETASEKFLQAQKSLDKAEAKGYLHKNTAARRKSRLAKALNASQN